MIGLAPLRSRPFRRLAAARTVSMLGNAVAPVALAFAVLDLRHSATDLGLIVGARSVTNVLLLLLGGVVADRLPRHLLLVGASLAAALTQALLATVVLTGTNSFALLAGLSAANGAVSAVALPAAAALVPRTVPAPLRQQANALIRIGGNTAIVAGASLGVPLVAVVGPGWGIAADAAAYLVAATMFAGIRPLDDSPPSPARTRIWTDLAQGWHEFASRTWLWSVVAAFTLINAAQTGAVTVLGPLVADRTFGRGGWGVVLAGQTIGLVLGGFVAMRLRVRRLLRFGMISVIAACLPLLALGVAPYLPVLVAAAFLAGIGIEQFSVAWDTTMQQHVPADRLARVYSYDMLGSFLAVPLGQILAGRLAETFGLRTTVTAAGAVVALAAAATLLGRDTRNLPNTALARENDHGRLLLLKQ